MSASVHRRKSNESIKVGDVFHGGHGWDGMMTHDFYVVTAVNGGTQVTLQRFEPERPEPTAEDRAHMGPYDSIVTAGDMSRDLVVFETVRRNVYVVEGYRDDEPVQDVYVKISDYEKAYKLDGADLQRKFIERD